MPAPTWSTTAKASQILLSNGDLTATNNEATSTERGGRATQSISTASIYFEVPISNKIDSTRMTVGIFKETPATWNGGPGSFSGGVGYINSGSKIVNGGSDAAFASSWGNGDILGVAYKGSTREVWFSKNGVWQGGGDPELGTNPAGVCNDDGNPKYAGYSIAKQNESLDLVASAFTYPIPNGFVAYDTTTFPVSGNHRQPLALFDQGNHRQPFELWSHGNRRQPIVLWESGRHRQPLLYWAQAAHRQPLDTLIQGLHRQPLALHVLTTGQHRQPLGQYSHVAVAGTHRQPLAEWLTARHLQPIRLPIAASGTHRQPLGLFAHVPVIGSHRQPLNQWAQDRHRQPLTQAAEIAVSGTHHQPLAQFSTDAVAGTHHQPLLLLDPATQIFTGSMRILIGNAPVAVAEARIAMDEDQAYWQAEITLLRESDYGRFPLGNAFTLEISGQQWALIVDTRTLSRARDDEGNPIQQAAITGLSPLALKAAPRAQSVTKTYETARTARSLVEELLGQSVTWNVVDWVIPAFRFGVSGQTPLEAARVLTEAVGALIESEPDGSVVVRSRFPVSVPAFETTAPAYQLTGDDIYSVDETVSAVQIVNRIAIRDGDPAAEQDTLEFEPDEANPLLGTVRAYPDPWRNSVRLTTTRNRVSIARLGVRTRIEEETIEVVAGRASVRWPVYRIQSLDWLDANLGGIAFQGREITATGGGYSLLLIRYVVRSIDYRVAAENPRDAQFLLEETR